MLISGLKGLSKFLCAIYKGPTIFGQEIISRLLAPQR